ncbi:ester cyclase [Pedobacter psychroterrae]|uniref:SnoaL-like polyketide cyclase n=1 Tax=Pedobacter psychroterrae TaxID=2530453 RepID=A0A4R0NRP9_9SPHI|nr:ester cyclase [Pedobacter psychroterrae]TCD02533.1 hypothetical protein EZ437_00660 [Pedobacter psychroterrae]
MKTTIKMILSGILALSTTVAFSQGSLNPSKKTNPVVTRLETKNTEFVKKFIDQVINGGKVNLIDKFWNPDMIWRGGSLGEINGIANYKAFAKANIGGAFTDMHLEVKDILAKGDKVMVNFTNSGKNTGEFMGRKATGINAKWNGMGMYRLKDGKITEATFSEDILDLLMQLGIFKL